MVFIGIILIFVAVGFFIVYWSKRPKQEIPNLSIDEKADYFQDQAKPGQGFWKNFKTRAHARSDTNTQQVVNTATVTATEGVRLSSDALTANLEKSAIPDRHNETRQKEVADTATYLTLQEAEQGEAGLRKELSAAASRMFLTVEDLSAVNKHGYLKTIDLEIRDAEIQQDLDAADRYDLTQHELINNLTAQLHGLVRERRSIELEEPDEYVRKRILDRYDKNISVVERIIDGRQTRLLLSENGQEVVGYSEEDTDSRADSSETPETDKE